MSNTCVSERNTTYWLLSTRLSFTTRLLVFDLSSGMHISTHLNFTTSLRCFRRLSNEGVRKQLNLFVSHEAPRVTGGESRQHVTQCPSVFSSWALALCDPTTYKHIGGRDQARKMMISICRSDREIVHPRNDPSFAFGANHNALFRRKAHYVTGDERRKHDSAQVTFVADGRRAS